MEWTTIPFPTVSVKFLDFKMNESEVDTNIIVMSHVHICVLSPFLSHENVHGGCSRSGDKKSSITDLGQSFIVTHDSYFIILVYGCIGFVFLNNLNDQ